MVDDPVMEMYEAQAELILTKEELEKIRRENEELKNQITDDSSMKKVSNNETSIKQNIVILLGGWDENSKLDSLLILHNGTNWKELTIKLPYAIDTHGSQFLNENLYIFGGRNNKGEKLNSTYKLSKSLQWEEMASMNEKRWGISNSSVILNNQIWVLGGSNGRETLKNVEMYDPETNKWKYMKEMNEPRANAGTAVVNGKIFCCGGNNGGNILKSTECYDSSTDIWIQMCDIPRPTKGLGAVEMDGNLIVMGGHDGKEALKSVWVLTTTDKSAEWKSKPCMPFSRCDFSITKTEGKIFVCGGDSGKINTNDMAIFDGEVWKNGPNLIRYRRYAAATIAPTDFVEWSRIICDPQLPKLHHLTTILLPAAAVVGGLLLRYCF